ncbi:MAG: alpha/beta fold hydrolase [Fibrobacteres bacterium]|nr:alpha/beta fold hydrolase [Fibrobacterota bacterium]
MYRYLRRPFSLKHEEEGFHERTPETGIIVGAEPYFLPGTNGEAVLFLHGYTSTPRDLRGVAEALNRIGYTAQGILFPGHGTKPTDLDKVTWQEWYSAAVEAYEHLKTSHSKVHVVGFSMGGSIALHLAANYDVGKLVLLSPLFKIAYTPWHIFPEEWWVKTIGHFLSHLKKTYSGNCNNPETRGRHIAYFHYSLSSINQTLAIVSEIRKELDMISNNLLLIHSKGDRTTSSSSSRRIFQRLKSPVKRFVWLYKSNHIITHDYEKDIVYREVLRFLSDK